MKILIALIAIFAVSCSTAKKSTTATSTGTSGAAAKTEGKSDTKTAQNEDKHKKKHMGGHVKKEEGKEAAKTAGAGVVTCKSGGDERVLENKETESGCEVEYTKEGKASSVATGSKGSKHCQEVMDRIHKKLEDAGYTCK